MKKISKYTIYNSAGLVIPTIAALPSFAIISQILGVEQFGIFLLAYTLTGLAGIFDFGITKAVILEFASTNDINKDKIIMGTSIKFGLVVYFFISIFLFFLSSTIVNLINTSEIYIDIAITSFKILSFAIGLNLLSNHFLSYLEGKQKFLEYNFVKILSGLLIVAMPALALTYDSDLENAFLGIFIARAITVFLSLVVLLKFMSIDFFRYFKSSFLKHLIINGWSLFTVNLLAPIIMQMDKLILSNILGTNVIAYYIAASDLIARLSIFPASLSKALFPMIKSSENNDIAVSRQSFFLLLIFSFLVIFPIFISAYWIFFYWLGDVYAEKSSNVLQILTIGLFFNTLSQIPFTKMQAHGKSNILTLLYIFEMPFYALFLYVFSSKYGIIGASWVWSLRNIFDFIAINILYKFFHENTK